MKIMRMTEEQIERRVEVLTDSGARVLVASVAGLGVSRPFSIIKAARALRAAERESGNMDKDKTWAELVAANSRRRNLGHA